jgi:hypothetical protein
MNKRIFIMVSVIVVASLFSAYSVVSAEPKKCSSSAIRFTITPQGKMEPQDAENHQITMYSYVDIMKSDCPEYDGCAHVGYGFSDYVGGSGPHQGYYMNINKDGDKEFGRYSGITETKVKNDESKDITFKGSYEITGGTGIFAGRQGKGTYEGEVTAEGVVWRAVGEVQ